LTESAQLALIAMFATVIVPSAVASWMAYLKSKQNATAINDLHVIVNDRLTQLLAITAAAKHAEGVIEGTAATQAATAAAAITAREVIAAREVTARAVIDSTARAGITATNTAAIVANTEATNRNTDGGNP
jgi:hypothetical protein